MINFYLNEKITSDSLYKIKEKFWGKIQNEFVCSIRLYDAKGKTISKEKKASLIDEELKFYGYSLRDLFFAEYDQFSMINSSFCGAIKFKNIYKVYKKKKRKYLIKDFFEKLYSQFRDEIAKEYFEDLEITVCPYCNRNFIDNESDDVLAEFDHFYEISNYPWLAISIENLVPCCKSCNFEKNDNKITYSPFDKKLMTDDVIKFRYQFTSLNDLEIFTIPLPDENGNKIMEKNIKFLKLDTQYKINRIQALQLIIKSQCYPEEYIQSIRLMLDGYFPLDLNPEEIYYGCALSNSKYHLYPLSKFSYDILLQIKQEKE